MKVLDPVVNDRRLSLFLLVGGALLFGVTMALLLARGEGVAQPSVAVPDIGLKVVAEATPPLPELPPPGVNLISNPSFEGGATGWQMVSLEGQLPVVLDSFESHGGGFSARFDRLHSGVCGEMCGYWTSKPIEVAPGRQYELIVWLKVSPELVGDSGLYLTIRTPDATGAYVPSATVSHIAMSGDWIELRAPVWEADADSVILDIAWLGRLLPDGEEGQIWIDDVFFSMLP